MSQLNPKTTQKDFFGVPGAFFLSFFLPTVVLFLYLCCNEQYVVEGLNIDFSKIQSIFRVQVLQNWENLLFNVTCWKVYLAWFVSLTLVDLIMPGYHKEGVPLRDGTKLDYLVNGKELSTLFLGFLASRAYITKFNLPELTFIYENFLGLMVTAYEFSMALSVFVYVCSFIPTRKPNGAGTNERILAVGGNSGNVVFDWFIGRELNPRIGSWDIKLFCELRPGMLLWLLFNLASAQKQYQELGYVTNSLILVNLLQAFYIFDGVLNEEGCLTMMDITTDGFGFMLAFGDLCWLPFTYCLQARYLSYNEVNLPYWAVGVICSIMVLGFYIFNASNTQKSLFRQGKLPHLKSIQTDKGTKLLVEGWWGISQHINYFGDILIATSWCLTTGFNTPLTYFYVIYFTCLLLHRQSRDEDKCRNKYGKYWQEYEKLVPWKIVPYVF